MAMPFEITAATNTVTLDNQRQGTATFTVRNLTRRRVRAVAKVLVSGPDSSEISWVGIVPADGAGVPATTDVRDFFIDTTLQYQVRIAAPVAAPPGSYAFKLVVADEINPDENYTQSPDVAFTLLEPAKPPPRSLPRWLIPLVLVGVLIIATVIALIVAEQNRQGQSREATQTAIENSRHTADAATAQAAVRAATQTAAAANQTIAAQTAAAVQRTADAARTLTAIAAARQTAVAATNQRAQVLTAIAVQRTQAAAARLTALAEEDICLINPRLPQCRLDQPIERP